MLQQQRISVLWLVVLTVGVVLVLSVVPVVQAGGGHPHHHHDHHIHGGDPDKVIEKKKGADGEEILVKYRKGDRGKDLKLKARTYPKIPTAHEPRVQGTFNAPKITKPNYFIELFQDAESAVFSRWKISTGPYPGRWEIDAPPEPVGLPGDKALIPALADPLKGEHFGIRILFDKPIISTGEQDLIIEYDVRFQQDEVCAGGYLKLLSATEEPVASNKDFQMDASTPYVIMFGPDRCQTTNKVHFIFRHVNPKTKKLEEKHLINPPKVPQDTFTHHYALHIHADSTFAILIDNQKVREGSLHKDFDPPVNPPKEIPDADHKKPPSWDDRKEIPDPFASKPLDWDEEEEIEISCGPVTSCNAHKPCYKKRGPWKAPLMPNPKYSGVWVPRNIPNPNYWEDPHPNRFAPISGVGIEVLSYVYASAFDNLIITNSKDAANELRRQAWDLKYAAETKFVQDRKDLEERLQAQRVEKAKKDKAERDAERNAPKNEEEMWAAKEKETQKKWDEGTFDFEDAKVVAQIVFFRYKQWAFVVLRWIEKHPVVFFSVLAGIFVLRFIVKTIKRAFSDVKKSNKPKNNKNNKKDKNNKKKNSKPKAE